MLSIRCFKCGWGWSMNAHEVAAALDAASAEEHTKYYMVECPNCRRANKISIKQMRRYAPPDWKPPAKKEAPKKEAAKKEAPKKEAS